MAGRRAATCGATRPSATQAHQRARGELPADPPKVRRAVVRNLFRLRARRYLRQDDQGEDEASSEERLRTLHVARSAVDTLLWQSLASVIIPGITIHQIVHATGRVMRGRAGIPFDCGDGRRLL